MPRARQPVCSRRPSDEVSAAIANFFGAYGQEYQAVISQAATFHSEFTQTLAAAGNAYAQAEAANAAAVSERSRTHISAPIQTLLGQTPTGAGGISGRSPMASRPAADPLIALIMGGTNNPQPDPST